MVNAEGIHRTYTDPLSDWTKLRNDWARDERLDWGALGLLTYLTSHKDGWEVELARLTEARSSKRYRVMAWLAELEEHGYLRREIVRRGKLVVGTRWHLLDPSDAGSQHQNRAVDNPVQSIV